MLKKIMCLVLLLFLLKYGISQGVTIIDTKQLPKELNLDFLKVVGDSIKFIKADDYNAFVYMINKKDTIEISFSEIKYTIKPMFEEAAKFEVKGKTKAIKNYPYSMLSVNAKTISFGNFIFEDLVKSKRYLFWMTKEKLIDLVKKIELLVGEK